MPTTTYDFRGSWRVDDDMTGWILVSPSGAVLDVACNEWLACAQGSRLSCNGSLRTNDGEAIATIAGRIGDSIQSAGGRARAKSMTKRERSASARKAVLARWAKRRK